MENSNNRAFELSAGRVRELLDEAETVMASIEEKNEEDLVSDKMASNENYKNARNMLLLLLAGISIFFGVMVAMWITLSINRSISAAVLATKTVASGDLTSDVEITSRDETGDLLGHMKEMVERLRQVVSDVTSGTANVVSRSQQLSSTTQQVSQGSTSEELAAQSEQLKATISFFKVKENGGGVKLLLDQSLKTAHRVSDSPHGKTNKKEVKIAHPGQESVKLDHGTGITLKNANKDDRGKPSGGPISDDDHNFEEF